MIMATNAAREARLRATMAKSQELQRRLRELADDLAAHTAELFCEVEHERGQYEHDLEVDPDV